MDHTQFLCIIQDFKRGMVVGAREFQKLLIYGDFSTQPLPDRSSQQKCLVDARDPTIMARF